MSVPKSHFLTGFVAVQQHDLAEAAESLGAEVVDPAVVLGSEDQPADDESLAEYEAALEEIGATLGFLEHPDPPEAVAQLGDRENIPIGSVINAVGLANHWSPFPGTWPTDVDHVLDVVPDATTGQEIGVIDSGVVPVGPDWFVNSIKYSGFDVETLSSRKDASHGTFIAGLLRQLACPFVVSVARLPLVHKSSLTSPGGMPPIFEVSTEVHLFAAMIKLMARSERPPVALNLSLGTYSLDERSSVTMRVAIEYWQSHAPESPIFAAGGNEYECPGVTYEELWPAAFGLEYHSVKGVGASDPSGTEVVWDYHDPSTFARLEPAPVGARPWIKVKAPGTDVISLGGHTRGDGAPQLVKWSGSSFATPIALANHLNGVSGDTAHTNVEGLTFDDNGAFATVPWNQSPCGVARKNSTST